MARAETRGRVPVPVRGISAAVPPGQCNAWVQAPAIRSPFPSCWDIAFVDLLLDNLTESQIEAVTHRDGPLLILAGPGSGKTRVITHRIAHLIREGVPPGQILAMTFTNKAADEMAARIAGLLEAMPTTDGFGEISVRMSTFHRFCAQMLRKYAPLVGIEANYTIYDTEDAARALRRTIESLPPLPPRVTPDLIGKTISTAKNNLLTPERYRSKSGDELGVVCEKVYPAYEATLRRANAVDFDDLLLLMAELLRENPEVRSSLDDRFRYVLVDEYQDTNLAQFAIVRAISVEHPNLAVTGDPDQSIYGWRGATLRNILEFERAYPDVRIVRLEQNYRSTQRILEVAAMLIRHNIRRKEKALFTYNGEGVPVRVIRYDNQADEARGIAEVIATEIRSGRRRAADFAVFYRTNALSRPIEFALREQGIPYQLVRGLEFFQRQEIKDVVAYLQLLANPRDEIALLRMINTPNRGIGRTTIDRLTRHALDRGIALIDAAREVDQIGTINPRSTGAVQRFIAMYDRLSQKVDAPVEELLGHVLTESGYEERLRSSGVEQDEDRLANIEELLSVARQFDEQHGSRLEGFLEETALVSDTDDWESSRDRVTLMTLHASKGLEFPVVFITAVEQGLVPHERSWSEPEQMEEERRLLFVGITRAKEWLQMSMARYRDFRGQRRLTIPSPFLMELPRDRMELRMIDAEGLARAEREADGVRVDTGYSQLSEADDVVPVASSRPSPPVNLPGLTTAARMVAESSGMPLRRTISVTT